MYLMPPNQLRNISNDISLQYYLFVFIYFISYGTIIITDVNCWTCFTCERIEACGHYEQKIIIMFSVIHSLHVH